MQSQRILAIRRKLSEKEPLCGKARVASVAVILRDGDDPRTLVIRRAEREEDPWSGHIAFPGGKWQKCDRSAKDTAAREVREETGIDLKKSARFLGYFGTFRTHTQSIEVIPSVYLLLDDRVDLCPNCEVSSYRWVALNILADPLSQSVQVVRRGATTLETPALVIGDYLIWGLTYRIISALFVEDT